MQRAMQRAAMTEEQRREANGVGEFLPVQLWVKSMQGAYDARVHHAPAVVRERQMQADRVNRKRTPAHFREGDLVLVADPNIAHPAKSEDVFRGPFRVVEKVKPHSYTVEAVAPDSSGYRKRIERLKVEAMKEYKRDPFAWLEVALSPVYAAVNEDRDPGECQWRNSIPDGCSDLDDVPPLMGDTVQDGVGRLFILKDLNDDGSWQAVGLDRDDDTGDWGRRHTIRRGGWIVGPVNGDFFGGR